MHVPLLFELVALVGGTVHTMEPDTVPTPATVLIRDGRIQAILGPEVALPAEARQVDVTGKHLVPGLIDGMVNFDPDHDALYVAHGVTTVRDVGSDPARSLPANTPEARDRVPGPALISPGAVLDGDHPTSSAAVILSSAHRADEILPEFIQQGVDYLAIQLALSEEALVRTLEIADENDLQVWGPVPRAVSLNTAVEKGISGVLYLDRLKADGVPWQIVKLNAFKPAAKLLAENGVGLVPVLRASSLRVEQQDLDGFDLGLVDPVYEGQWRAELQYRKELMNEEYVETGKRISKLQRDLLVLLREEGVAVVPGSGAPSAWLYPGRGLHEELADWVQAGIAPIEVLDAATRGAAEAMGIGAERGTLAQGKWADVLALDADPREGLGTLAKPHLVVVRGHVLDRALLDDRLATLRQRFDEYRAALAEPIEVPDPELPEGVVVLEGMVAIGTLGQAVRAERYAVVREPDGAISYVGHTAYRPVDDEPRRGMTVLQRVRDGKLEEYKVSLINGDQTITSRGLWVGSQLNIERRAGNVLMDTNSASQQPTCVDVGSVTSHLLLTQLVRTEPFYVIRLVELLDPQLTQWVMAYGGEEDLMNEGEVLWHHVVTPRAKLTFTSTALGSVRYAQLGVGGGILEFKLIEEDAHGGAGMPPPAEKLALVTPSAEDGHPPEESGDPDDPDSGEEAGASGDEGGEATGGGEDPPGGGDGRR